VVNVGRETWHDQQTLTQGRGVLQGKKMIRARA
jgi:hypothetical protein